MEMVLAFQNPSNRCIYFQEKLVSINNVTFKALCELNRNCLRSAGAEDLSDRCRNSASKVKISKRSGVKVTSLIVKLPKTWFEPRFSNDAFKPVNPSGTKLTQRASG
jgi:hypothetical protein